MRVIFYQDKNRWWWLVERSDPMAIQGIHGPFLSREAAEADADKFKNGLEI